MFLCALAATPFTGLFVERFWTVVALIGLAAAHQEWPSNLSTTVSDKGPRQSVASMVGMGGQVGR